MEERSYNVHMVSKQRSKIQHRTYSIDGHGDPIEMTLPDERYRALQRAEQLLEDLLDRSKTPGVPRWIREQARSVLRHFPGPYYIEELSRARPDIIVREMDDLHRFIRSREPDPEVSGPLPAQERDPSL